jgi:hypothetical protein
MNMNKVSMNGKSMNGMSMNEVSMNGMSMNEKVNTRNKKIKTGCLDPLKGYRKKCVIDVVDIDSNGNEFGNNKNNRNNFGNRKKIRLVNIKKSNKSGKKLMATFEVGGKKKIIHFGAAGMSDYTKHKNLERRNRYIFRHRKDLKTGDPTRAGYLSMFVLWNKPTLSASVADYRRRLAKFNNSGKFPNKILYYRNSK